tara:strand:+ start:103 stop:420 length:318 start_codon:yes stop_codon:yes gene_type:complete
MAVKARLDGRTAKFHFLFEHWQGTPELVFVTCTSKDSRKHPLVGIFLKKRNISVKIYEPDEKNERSKLDKRFPLCDFSPEEIELLCEADIKASISLTAPNFRCPN